MSELAQGRQQVWAAGNKNGGTNHVSDRPDLCQIKMTMQLFLKKNTHRETRSEKHTVYKSCWKSSYTTRKHPFFWGSHARGFLAVEFTTCSHLLGRSMNWEMSGLCLSILHCKAGIQKRSGMWQQCLASTSWQQADRRERGRYMDFPSLAFKQLVVILNPNTENLKSNIVNCFLTCILAEIVLWHLMLPLNCQLS